MSPPRILLPNLRTNHIPIGPWTVQSGSHTAEVAAGASKADEKQIDKRSWSLQIRFDAPVLEASSPTPDVKIRGIEPQPDGTSRIHLEVAAPTMCAPETAREPVELSIRFQGQNQTTHTFQVDHRCLLGDYLKRSDAMGLHEIALRHWNDPALKRILASAPKPTRSLDEEMRYLKTAIRFGPSSYQSDPLDEAPGWTSGTAYVLAPEETIRLGGDCEDYAILAGLYLSHRGFSVSLAMSPSHAWVLVHEGNRDLPIDLAAPSPHWNASSTASLSLLSMFKRGIRSIANTAANNSFF